MGHSCVFWGVQGSNHDGSPSCENAGPVDVISPQVPTGSVLSVDMRGILTSRAAMRQSDKLSHSKNGIMYSVGTALLLPTATGTSQKFLHLNLGPLPITGIVNPTWALSILLQLKHQQREYTNLCPPKSRTHGLVNKSWEPEQAAESK